MRTAIVAIVLLAGCHALQNERERCASLVDSAWQELDASKAEGFAGAVSHTKAAGLITHAKLQQTLERFPSCVEAANSARFYIKEARAGR